MSCHNVRSQWVCMRSEVNSGAFVTFNSILTSDLISDLLTSFIFIVISECHCWSRIDLRPHTYSLWPQITIPHTQVNFKLFWFSLTLCNCNFTCHTKIDTVSLLIVTHQWFFKWWTLINLIREANWPNASSYF